jgi:glycosyltransferase involved in cell wall biosynthesis
MSLHISVITAVLNRAQTLEASLRSVQAQSWPHVEHIVVDGGSTDGSLAIIERARAGIAQVLPGPDGGLYDALNKGIRAARGDVVGFMHADDTYATPEALARVAAAFEDPAVDAVYGDLEYLSKDGSQRVVRYWRAGSYRREQLAQGWMPPHPTFYVRRECYARLGGFDTRFRISADYENMLRLLWRGGLRAAYIPEVLVRMTLGGMSNGTLLQMLRKSREDYAAMRQNGIGSLQALLLKNVTKLPQFVVRAAPAR